ncbi:hypothetical protein SAMN06298216_2840 [Spirosomataceae bacterium TFI 002]|nr:hypothetical protein SAMN06298216_2840 [Spirosomataceae bacterium TFI 002]
MTYFRRGLFYFQDVCELLFGYSCSVCINLYTSIWENRFNYLPNSLFHLLRNIRLVIPKKANPREGLALNFIQLRNYNVF